MKQNMTAILTALCLALLLCACAAKQSEKKTASGSSGAQSAGTEPATAPLVWSYEVETVVDEEEPTADDGTVVATIHTELPRLVLKCDGEAAGAEAPREMQAVCDAFNAGVTAPDLWEVDTAAEAKERYELNTVDIDFFPLCEELTIGPAYRRGDLLSVEGAGYIFLGGAHPDREYVSWNFDLGTGEFITPAALSDEPSALCGMLADEIITEIYCSEWYDGYNDGFEELIRAKPDFDAFFDENGMTVYFGEYEIAPYAMGTPMFTIPYAKLSRFLSESAERLLDLSAEDRALGDFYEADELCYWCEGGAPVDYETSRSERVGEGGESWDMYYARVDIPGVTTMEALRERLRTRFSDALVEQLLAPDEIPMFREFDGELYMALGDRGINMEIRSVDYRAEMDAGGRSGKVIATIQWQEYDDELEDWVLSETSEEEFPFELTENGARFTAFRSLW